MQYLSDIAKELMKAMESIDEEEAEIEAYDAKSLLHHPIAAKFWTRHFGRNVYHVSWSQFRGYIHT